ncbi:putative peptidase [Escherichia coli]|uniref:Putative peptidase n=1 Tax=Escherichia coli TaxID=562 RepID=A0A377CY02_ECOLX|nr:putative peptidase [Escherichia coli]
MFRVLAATVLHQNAVITPFSKMGPILGELQELSQRLGYDEFLGKGTLTVSEIFFTSPSRCAVADSCAVSIDRRLTWGETWEGALDEIRALPAVQKLTRLFLCTTTTVRPGLAWLPNRMLLPDLESGRRSLHR